MVDPMTSEHRSQGTTRSAILQLLRRNGSMTASELSNVLGVGAVGIRQHLTSLCSESLVTTVGVRRGLGRPSHLYALTPTAERLFPKAYERVALDALSFLAGGGKEQVDLMFESRRQKQLVQYRERVSGNSVEERIESLTTLLNEQGYMCEWERNLDGSITFAEHNCPIDCIARTYPQACAGELQLYEELIGAPIERITTIIEGAASCRFRVVIPKSAP